jgi:anti-sigma regulatory factor (Ser/Thr protein kinase)
LLLSDKIRLNYLISPDDFTRAGEASSDVKGKLKQMGVNPEAVRKVAIAMYEGEINMVIHAKGGTIEVIISPDEILMVLADKGPGIADIEQAMQAGFSTAPDNVRSLGFGAGYSWLKRGAMPSQRCERSRSNENKIRYGYRRRALIEMEGF